METAGTGGSGGGGRAAAVGGGAKCSTASTAMEGPKRKLKAGMVGLIGALTALEQNDMEAFGAVLARNNGAGGQEFRLGDQLEAGLYAMFEPRLQLLDVALMLGRKEAAELLLDYGAQDTADVPSVDQRCAVVHLVLGRCEKRALEIHQAERTLKEDEKRARQLDVQLCLLRQMHANLTGIPQVPASPCNVHCECISSTSVAVTFDGALPKSPNLHLNTPTIIRIKVEWSAATDFSPLDGQKEVCNIRTNRIRIDGLPLGGKFAFRISFASIWGWGLPTRAEPDVLRISSWSELEGQTETGQPNSNELADLVDQVEHHRQGPIWQRIFPSCSPIERDRTKRKSGLKHLFSASSKFVKNVQRGLYLASVFYTEGRILCTVDDCLPVICVDETSTGLAADELHWLMKLSLCWEQLQMLQESLGNCATGSANSQLRARLLDAAVAMHNALGVRDIGRVHHIPVQPQPGISLIVTVRLVSEAASSEAQGLAMRWMRMEKLLRRRQSCSALDCLNKELLPLLNFYESSLIPLQPGLYLAYLRLHSSLNSIHLLVPENVTSALPFAQIRTNGHVTLEEWTHLHALAQLDERTDGKHHHAHNKNAMNAAGMKVSEEQKRFHEQLATAARTLIHDLELDPEQLLGTRLFRHRLVQLNEQVTLILVMPRAEEVCQVNASTRSADSCSTSSICGSILSGSGPIAGSAAAAAATIVGNGGVAISGVGQFIRGCMSVPVPVFQMTNLFAYQPDFLIAYCSLSVFLEHFLTVCQYEQRACLIESEQRVYAEQFDQLQQFQHQLETIWRSSRWISNFASVARDRGFTHRGCSLRLTRLLRAPEDQQPTTTDFGGPRERLVSVLARRNGLVPPPPLSPFGQPQQLCCSTTTQQSQSCSSSPAASAKALSPAAQPSTPMIGGSGSSLPTTPCRQKRQAREENGNEEAAVQRPHMADAAIMVRDCSVLRVFAAYDTGLPQTGISVRLRIYENTTASEVIQLVVRQIAKLNPSSPTHHQHLTKSVNAMQQQQSNHSCQQQQNHRSLSSSPTTDSIMPMVNPAHFCLVSVLGARERRFANEFPVLRIGKPWDKGRFCVRHLRQIGAAIELANETAV